jgi:hypothetical protein
MAEAKDKAGQRFPEDHTIVELRASATRALAESDDYSRRPLREQLEDEEVAPQ